MARQTLTALSVASSVAGYPSTGVALGTPASFTAADASNKEQVVHTGKEVLLVFNSGAGARTVTVSSSPDFSGRSGDITAYSIAAGALAWIGPFDPSGWRQSDGKLYFEASHAEVKYKVIQLP